MLADLAGRTSRPRLGFLANVGKRVERVKFLCDQCQAKYQIADEKAAGKTVRMKCRKCGHLIEVRATVVDGSDAMSIPPPGQRPNTVARPSQKPPPPRHAPLATSLASAKAPPRASDKPTGGALAGAFRSNVQRDDEVSAPVDMSDLSVADEWYVAINGVPVGPIRIAEVRRKAAIGAVTEESLCWQEGLDEWRALRSFPELATIVREAFASGRSSLTPPPPEGRRSATPPPPRHSPSRPPTPAGVPPRAPPQRPMTSPPAPAPRSNVVPITSRLATAEKLADAPDALTRPAPHHFGAAPDRAHSVVPDPFAAPPQPAQGGAAIAPPQAFAAAAAPFVSATPSFSTGLPAGMPSKKGPPWMAIAMIAAAVAFGVTAGVAVFLRPPPAAPTPVVVQVPAAPAAVALAAPTSTQTTTTTADPTPSPGPSTPRSALALATAARSSAAAAPSATMGHGLDLHSISPGSNVLPTDEPGSGDTPKAVAGQGVSGAQVSQVVGLHQVALRRNCWERNPSQKTAVNVSVTFTVAGDGSVQGVSATGDEPSIATCIANDVKGWHFPATGASQPVNVPFHFVKQ
jgi:predicted Zn finger-like uncharacterized protein